jgi:hypothetical protein
MWMHLHFAAIFVLPAAVANHWFDLLQRSTVRGAA